ncbi:MAG: hypothetical protein ABW168_08705 [Sedimenticola sp.]
MARKVKETPILKGEDARAFSQAIEANKTENKKVPSSDYKRAKENFRRISLVVS